MKVKNKTDLIICLACVIIITIISLTGQALGYGNIAVEQGQEGISTNYISSLFTGIGSGLELAALVKLVNRPVQSILFTLLSQLVLFLSDITQGYSFYESLANTGVFEIYFNLVAVGMLVVIWRSYSKQAKKNNEQLALSKYIKFERLPLKVPMWAIFSIACLGLSLVLSSAYNVEVGLWSDNLPFRVYVGLTLFIPTLTTLAMYTASNLVYYLYGIMMALKTVVMVEMLSTESLKWTMVVTCVLQSIVYVYCVYRYITSLKAASVNK